LDDGLSLNYKEKMTNSIYCCQDTAFVKIKALTLDPTTPTTNNIDYYISKDTVHPTQELNSSLTSYPLSTNGDGTIKQY